MIPIDINIPIPYIHKRSLIIQEYKRPTKYPFREMNIGDSFFVPLSGYKTEHTLRSTLYDAAKRRGKGENYRIIVRQVDGGMRCWRIQ